MDYNELIKKLKTILKLFLKNFLKKFKKKHILADKYWMNKDK